jgi:hypothetical protein
VQPSVTAAGPPSVTAAGPRSVTAAGQRLAPAADPERAAAFELDRDRLAALLVEGLIILVPCLLWFVHYARELSVCGAVVSDTAPQCSGVGVRCLAALAGLIAGSLVTIGAAAALFIRVTRARRSRSAGTSGPGPLLATESPPAAQARWGPAAALGPVADRSLGPPSASVAPPQ